MAIDRSTVLKIATLARIRVPEAELDHLAGELQGIVQWVEQLNQVDVSGVEPMTSVRPMRLKMRKDEVTDGAIELTVELSHPRLEGLCREAGVDFARAVSPCLPAGGFVEFRREAAITAA